MHKLHVIGDIETNAEREAHELTPGAHAEADERRPHLDATLESQDKRFDAWQESYGSQPGLVGRKELCGKTLLLREQELHAVA